MNTYELALWSALQGVLMMCTALSLVQAVQRPSWGTWLSALYLVMVAMLVGALSGWLGVVWPPLTGLQVPLALVAGPMSGVLAMHTLSRFLRAKQRDNAVLWGLRVAIACWLLALLIGLLPNKQAALGYQAPLMLVGAVIAAWMTVRAALLGDRLAWVMATATTCVTLTILGLYGHALGYTRDSFAAQVSTTLLVMVYVLLTMLALMRRAAEHAKMRRAVQRDPSKDLLTQLWTGAGFAKQVDAAMARSRRNRSTTALLHVEIFNLPALKAEHGPYAVEEVIYTLAARVQETAGTGNVVGRYGDNSFVVVLGSIKNADVLRTMGIRLAATARRIYLLNPKSAHPREFRADIGVGVVRVNAAARGDSSISPLDDEAGEESMQLAHAALHEAEHLARLARDFPSRVAVFERRGGPAVALEQAQL